jgi:hypothetical protein
VLDEDLAVQTGDGDLGVAGDDQDLLEATSSVDLVVGAGVVLGSITAQRTGPTGEQTLQRVTPAEIGTRWRSGDV